MLMIISHLLLLPSASEMPTRVAGDGKAHEDGAEAVSPLLPFLRMLRAGSAADAASMLAAASYKDGGRLAAASLLAGAAGPLYSTLAMDLAPGPEVVEATVSGQPATAVAAGEQQGDHSMSHKVLKPAREERIQGADDEYRARAANSVIGNGHSSGGAPRQSPEKEHTSPSLLNSTSSPAGKRRQPIKRKRTGAESSTEGKETRSHA